MTKKNKIAAVCIATDDHLEEFKKLENSLRKFHTKEELPLFLIGSKDLKDNPDKDFFYRATPIVGKQFLEKYETVIKLDSDQIITGDISHVWEGEFDVAVVNNSNPKEMKKLPVGVWNIHPMAYVNAGFVVMRSLEFVDHWLKLCYSPHFYQYQMREQDLLNIIVHYGNYAVKPLDAGTKWHGLISKGYWPKVEMKKGKMMLERGKEWPSDGNKEIVCIHFAGGKDPQKGNYKLHFKPEVVKYIDKLVSDVKKG